MMKYIDQIISCIQNYQKSSSDENDLSLYSKWLHSMEYLRTDLASGDPSNDRIPTIEKLLCDPWLNDGDAFEKIYSLWSSPDELDKCLNEIIF